MTLCIVLLTSFLSTGLCCGGGAVQVMEASITE